MTIRVKKAFMTVKNFKQSVAFQAPPHKVYELLVNAKKHEKFTWASAHLDDRPGERFEHYEGQLYGLVVDLESDRPIVLA